MQINLFPDEVTPSQVKRNYTLNLRASFDQCKMLPAKSHTVVRFYNCQTAALGKLGVCPALDTQGMLHWFKYVMCPHALLLLTLQVTLRPVVLT